MAHFLIIFDRSEGRLLSETAFADGREALAERFKAERMHRGSDVEVVVLTAESKAALRRTHARYFRTVSELAGRADSAMAAADVNSLPPAAKGRTAG